MYLRMKNSKCNCIRFFVSYRRCNQYRETRYRQNLIIDDFLMKNNEKKLTDLATRGRKMNAPMLYITQD